jgi:hypothetical protein
MNKSKMNKKNKFGGKNCTKKCKEKYYKILKKSTNPKVDNYKKFFSFLGVKNKDFDKLYEEEIKKILDQKETQNHPAFKLCKSDCEKSRK